MDAPLWVHWPKLGLWVAFEAVLLALTGYLDHINLPIKTSEPAGTELKCKDWQYNCAFDGEQVAGLVSCWVHTRLKQIVTSSAPRGP